VNSNDLSLLHKEVIGLYIYINVHIIYDKQKNIKRVRERGAVKGRQSVKTY